MGVPLPRERESERVIMESWSKIGWKRSVGRTETDRKITGEPWSSTLGQRNMTKENTLRSGCGSAFKKRLTEPALLEMSGLRVSGLGRSSNVPESRLWLTSEECKKPEKVVLQSVGQHCGAQALAPGDKRSQEASLDHDDQHKAVVKTVGQAKNHALKDDGK